MKKLYKYNEPSGIICAVIHCTKKLKKNLLMKKAVATLCYVHHCAVKGLDPKSRKNNKQGHTRRIDAFQNQRN